MWTCTTGTPLAPCADPRLVFGRPGLIRPWWWPGATAEPGRRRGVGAEPIEAGAVAPVAPGAGYRRGEVGAPGLRSPWAGPGGWQPSPQPGYVKAPPVGPLGPLGTRRAAQAGPGVPRPFVRGPGVPGAPIGPGGPGAPGAPIGAGRRRGRAARPVEGF